MQPHLPDYHTYILRFWRETAEPGQPAIWRFTIEDPTQGNRQGFATLTALVAFLQNTIDEDQP